MDYISFCKSYFEATGIPVTLLCDALSEFSALGDMLSLAPQKQWELFPLGKNPSFCGIPPDLLFGRVHVENTAYDVILGPVFSVPVNDQTLRVLMRELMVPFEKQTLLCDFFYAAPTITSLQLAKHLSLIHLSLNHKVMNPDDLFRTIDLPAPGQTQIQERIEDLEHEHFRNSYLYETDLYEHIREGDIHKLNAFFKATNLPPAEGKMAVSPLRHAKNRFISNVSRIGFIAAIPGGVDIEKTYQLIDYYVLECERLTTIEAVSNLQYAMMMDFCRRSGETKLPDGVSSDVFLAMNYIRSGVNRPITLEEVAAHVHRSVSYLMKEFKNELGFTVGTFITRCKLEEAKSMLTYTEMSLAEISSYLCFSSQSYFQNVFKKKYGVTPMQYRKNSRKL